MRVGIELGVGPEVEVGLRLGLEAMGGCLTCLTFMGFVKSSRSRNVAGELRNLVRRVSGVTRLLRLLVRGT